MKPRSDGSRLARGAAAILAASVILGSVLPASADAVGTSTAAVRRAPAHAAPSPGGVRDEGCLVCHTGIEEMHPGFPLSCVECHGGDGEATKKDEAHVQKTVRSQDNERVDPIDQDLGYVRFVNPMDLRVAEATCGDCHEELVEHLMISLHGTTAGHLSDGFYENGLHESKASRYAVFRTEAPDDGEDHAVELLVQPPRMDTRDDPKDIATHFPDLVRKECMQCHLWSAGRAVRGRVGFDGEYRGGGCAACHVPYAVDGFSASADRTAKRNEPGHPRVHAMTSAPPTETCTTCHYGDASIGLHFRGLSQLPPGAPGGPEIDGTTDALLHRSFFIDDPAMTPPDVHHASGLHCVDCHTLQGIMGDGRMLSKMEQATEISCEACHGTFEERSTMKTERGTRLRHLFERDGGIWMRSKVTGAEHRIKQAVDVLNVAHPDYNQAAAQAMTGAHADVACYTCHAGWNVNFLGFHFYRNEALTQLDLISGERTKGRVTTQEKVFTTWKSFYAGLDERGRVAPYLTGFSTMGTVDGEDGERILDQALPVTKSGLSGLTMIHHQLHSTRPTARSCVECHRASETWGMGSANFRLGRQVVFAAERRGIEVLAFDRENPQSSVALTKIVLPDVVDMELRSSPLSGHAEVLFATEAERGLHAFDVTDPRAPVRVGFRMAVSPRGMALAGDHLFVADGVGGLKVFDVRDPEEIERVATLPTIDAHDVEIRWPHAFVADGIGGLVVVDVSVPVAPRVVGGLEFEAGGDGRGRGIVDLDVLFQYSRPMVNETGEPADERTEPRRLIAVCDDVRGPILVDATEPAYAYEIERAPGERAARIEPREGVRYTGVALRSHVDVASPQGGEKTVERDVLYFTQEREIDGGADRRTRVVLVDVSRPDGPRPLGSARSGNRSSMLRVGAWYNPPFLSSLTFVAGDRGVSILNVANSREPVDVGAIVGLGPATAFVAESFPLDEMLDANGEKLKDVSHPESRWLLKGEIQSVLAVSGEDLGTVGKYDDKSVAAASSARSVFVRADRDGSGLLSGAELRAVDGTSFDSDGDGRVTLFELSREDLLNGRSVAEPPATAMEDLDEGSPRDPRARPDGELARLLDGIDPFEFDGDQDGRLSKKEGALAFFAAFDLDGDGRLDVHEQSRHPGDLRDLRFGDVERRALKRREYEVRAEDWRALDGDGDGELQLPGTERDRRRGGMVPVDRVEWPRRRGLFVYDLPPDVNEQRLLETFDRDGDGQFTRSELRRRPELFTQLDQNRSGVVEAGEITRARTRIADRGLDAVADGFEARWDLDGDGEAELPSVGRWAVDR